MTLASGSAQGQTDAPACVPCLVIGVGPSSLDTLAPLPPGSLEGLRVVLPSHADAPDTLAAASKLASAGALVGAAVYLDSALPEETLRKLAFVVVLPAQVAAAPRQSIFSARTTITALRAHGPHLAIVIDDDAFRAIGVPSDTLVAYADAVIGRGRTWSRLSPVSNPDAEALIALSLTPGSERVLVDIDHLDWRAALAFVSRRATAVDVGGTHPLTVEELLARHQVQQRRQDELIRTITATGTTTLLFELPGFAAPVTISADTTIFRSGGGARIEERNIRVNGAAIAGGGSQSQPRLPLIEAERISTPPLAITLGEAYGYVLEGVEAVDGGRCYVVRFKPLAEAAHGMANGRAWIDASDFALRRLEVVQRDLRGAIVSSEQVDEFGRVDVDGSAVWLPRETTVFQSYEGPGLRTPIHRTTILARYEVNGEAFASRLDAALGSDNVMLEETRDGMRYLIRRPGEGPRRAGDRARDSISSAVAGVVIDPNITTPLPFAGLSYVNLNLFQRGAQLNAFFGGTIAQAAWSVPSLRGTRWQMHGSGFAIAARYNDRVFRGGREQYAENLAQRPARLTAGVLRRVTPRLHATVDYELAITTLERTAATEPAFGIPSTLRSHGITLALDLDRAGWGLRGWWNPARRQSWRAWGAPGQFRESTRDYQRYGAQLTRTIALEPSFASRVQMTWMAGHDLDRFSRYSVDSFDNPVHGYATASIRYDRGAVVRSVTSWSGHGLRLEAFGDVAVAHDPGWTTAVRTYPGIGAGLELAGPRRTLWSIEWGYGFQASRQDGGRGTQAARITMYRGF